MATQPISDPAHEGEMPDIRSRLRAVLEADLAANKLVVSSHSAIKRLHYARLLGCSPSRMSQIAEVFEEFEGRTSLVYVKPESNLAARLRAALEADAEIGAVRTSRGGKINRSHYARQFGYTSTALNGFGAIFSDFESRLNVVTGPMRHLADMRAWLQKAYAAGELGVRNGKIDRVEFAKRFKLRGGTFMSRHPEIRALIAEYDARVEQDGYLPAALAEDLERVRRALAAGPELNKDRMTINTVALSAASKVPQGRFRDRHFADAIAEVQAAIVANATASRIDPLVHGRVFPFSDLSSHWPVSFLERVGMRFKIFASTLASTAVKQPYLQLLAALRWIGASENPHCLSVVEHAAQRSIPAEPWEEALYAYRGHLMADIASGASSHTAVDSALTGLRSAIGFLAGGQVVPETSVPLAGVKYARRRTQPLRCVAEVGQGRQADYVAFARDRFTEACRMVGSEMDSGEADLFFQGLSSELAVVSALPADPSEAILAVLDLLQWLTPEGAILHLNVGRHLDDFATAVGVPQHTPRGGVPTTWHWAPHQFRRFFAILYFYRFEGASIEVLSHHLRHFSLEMTKRYITEDPEVASIVTDVEWSYMGDVARSIAAGERSVAGSAGAKLKKTARRLIDLLRRKVHVVASIDNVGAALNLVMQRSGMVLTPKPWVTCSCPRTKDAALVAGCRHDSQISDRAVGPDFAQAGPSVCSACPHAIIEGDRQGFIAAEIEHLENVAANDARSGTIFGALERERVVELRQFRDVRQPSSIAVPATDGGVQ